MRDERLVRDELLGRASADDQAFLIRLRGEDTDFDEWCSSVETSLIDEYVQNELSPPDRELFERVYLTTDERRRKVEFSRVLLAAHRRPSRWQQWALAATLLVMVAIGLMWFAHRPQPVLAVHVAMPPKVKRDNSPLKVVEIPASALVLEIEVVPGRTATLYLSGEEQPLFSSRLEGTVFRIPTADLDETEYRLVVANDQPVEHYVFRIARQPTH